MIVADFSLHSFHTVDASREHELLVRCRDVALQMLEAATAAGKKTEKLQGSLQVESACGSCIWMFTPMSPQALQAQLDRVVSSQPMKRQDTAADAEVVLPASVYVLVLA